MSNRLDYSYLDHPTLRRMPATEQEWTDYNRVILETAGNVVQGLLDNGQVADQSVLPMVQAGNKGSVQSAAPLTATDAGASATVNIAAHTVQYDFGTVSYNAGSITGLSYEVLYYVYADDPDYDGGAVTYYASTTVQTLTSDRGRYYLGAVTTPASGGGDTEGGGGGGGGGGNDGGDENIWL